MPPTSTSASKVRRNPRACDACSRRSVRCRPSSVASQAGACQKCAEYGELCTFNRTLGRRGARPKHEQVRRSAPEHIPSPRTSSVQSACIAINGSWQPSLVPPQALVMDLAEVFLAIVYPVFPLFHKQTLMRRASRGEHLSDRPFHASLLAMCALALARVRDGALLQGPWHTPQLPFKDEHLTSEALFDAARAAIPAEAPLTQDFEYMRASALLAITAIQYGNMQMMRYYLNLYHMFVAVGALHDEVNWPKELTAIQLEERRRLYWSTYTLDVFTAVIWNSTVRSREATSKVAYPSLLDEEMSLQLLSHEPRRTGQDDWLMGWNFITDLYRILEHAADDLGRLQTDSHRPPAIGPLLEMRPLSQHMVLEHITTLYSTLPEHFRSTREPTGCATQDLASFQAANITATVQLVRMVYLTNDPSATLHNKCQVASEVIMGFTRIPSAYLKAISVPLLYHLGGIGSILGTTFERGMTVSSYHKIRSVLLELAQLLASLEEGLLCATGTGQKLQALVMRIDEYMSSQPLPATQQATIAASEQCELDSEGAVSTLATHPLATETDSSPEYLFPTELFVDWSWALDLFPDSTA